jgi:hypothetical protein
MAATTETIKTLSLGTGVDCNKLIADNLSPADFPKQITVENCVDYFIFAGGVKFYPCHDEANKTRTIEVKTFDEMQRLASDFHAVGNIRNKPELVKISFSVEEPVVDENIEPPVTTGKQKTTAAPKTASE